MKILFSLWRFYGYFYVVMEMKAVKWRTETLWDQPAEDPVRKIRQLNIPGSNNMG